MAKHSYERDNPKHIALLALLFISVGAIALVSDTASAQQQQRFQVRPAATGTNPPERTNTVGSCCADPHADVRRRLGPGLSS